MIDEVARVVLASGKTRTQLLDLLPELDDLLLEQSKLLVGSGLRFVGHQPLRALGKRVSKSSTLAHVGRTAMRHISASGGNWLTHASPCSSPKYRLAEAAYSGTTPSTCSTLAIPRIES